MTAKALEKIRKSGGCVVWLSGRHMPAAFLCSMQYWRVAEMLPHLKPYKPKRNIFPAGGPVKCSKTKSTGGCTRGEIDNQTTKPYADI